MNVPLGLQREPVSHSFLQSSVAAMLVEVRSDTSLQMALDLCGEHLDLVYFPTSIHGALAKK